MLPRLDRQCVTVSAITGSALASARRRGGHRDGQVPGGLQVIPWARPAIVVRLLDLSSSCASKRERAPGLVTAGLTAAMDRGSGRPNTTAPLYGLDIQ